MKQMISKRVRIGMRAAMMLAVVMMMMFATTTEALAQTKYKITTDGNCEVYYYDNFETIVVTEAEAGKELSVRVKADANPGSGKYFTGEFTLNGSSLGSNQWGYNEGFTMPAENVTIVAVKADKQTLSFDLKTTTQLEVPPAAALLFNGDGRLNYNDELGGYDVDNSGVADMIYYDVDGEHNYVQRLAGADATGTYTLTYPDNRAMYGSISFIFPEKKKIQVQSSWITLSGTEFTYTGQAIEPTVTVMDGNTPVDVTLEYSNNKNAGTATVTVTAKTTSTGYTGSASKTFTITPKPVTISGVKANDKVYDGTTDATIDISGATIDGKVGNDEVNIVAGSAVFSDKNAGEGIAVTFSGFSLTGTNAGNYTLSAQPASVTGTIHRKALELVANAVTIKEGDAVPLTFTGSVKGFVAGENISAGDKLLFTLSDPSACTPGSYGITGTLNGSASGNYGQNYTFSNAAANATAFTIISAPALDESKPVVVSEEDGGAAAGTYYALDESVASSLIKTNKTKSQVRLLFSDDTQVKTKSKIVNGKKTHTIKISGKAAKKIKARAFVKSLPKGVTFKIIIDKKVSTARYKKLAKQLRKAGFKGKIKRKTRAAEGDDVDEDEIESGVEYEVLEDCDLFFDIISDEDDDEDIEIEGIMIRQPGDANGDDKVDAADLVEMVNAKEGKPTSENFNLLNADINEDGEGEVDQNDIDVVVDMIME